MYNIHCKKALQHTIFFQTVLVDQALCCQENLPLNALQQIMQNKCKLYIIQHKLSWPFREDLSCMEINFLSFLFNARTLITLPTKYPIPTWKDWFFSPLSYSFFSCSFLVICIFSNLVTKISDSMMVWTLVIVISTKNPYFN